MDIHDINRKLVEIYESSIKDYKISTFPIDTNNSYTKFHSFIKTEFFIEDEGEFDVTIDFIVIKEKNNYEFNITIKTDLIYDGPVTLIKLKFKESDKNEYWEILEDELFFHICELSKNVIKRTKYFLKREIEFSKDISEIDYFLKRTKHEIYKLNKK